MLELAAIAFVTLYAIPRAIFLLLSAGDALVGVFHREQSGPSKAYLQTRSDQDEYLSWDRETRIKYHVFCRKHHYAEVFGAYDLEPEVKRRLENAN